MQGLEPGQGRLEGGGAICIIPIRLAKPEHTLIEVDSKKERSNRVLQRLFPSRQIPLPELQCTTTVVHENSRQSEYICLRNRVLMLTPKFSRVVSGDLSKSALEIATWLNEWCQSPLMTTREATEHMVLKHGPGPYKKAGLSLINNPVEMEDTKIKFFIKAEKWRLEPGEYLKEPRAIQSRNPRYNIMLARFLVRIEEGLTAAGNTSVSPNALRLYTTKGLNGSKKAQLIADIWNRYPRAAALSGDYSRFDAHVSREVLLAEHSVYKFIHKPNRLLNWLLAAQLKNRGRTRFGWKYTVSACRMSGDVNTSLGNTICNWMVLRSVTREYPVSCIAEGDDSLIIGNLEDILALSKTMSEDIKSYGMTFEYSLSRSFTDLDYCSARYICPDTKPMQIREWPKPLQTDALVCLPVIGRRAVLEKAYTVATGCCVMYRGQPVYQAWASYLCSWSAPTKIDLNYDRSKWYTYGQLKDGLLECELGPITPTLDTRCDFAIVTGFAITDQHKLEEWFADNVGPYPQWPTCFQTRGGLA